LHYIHIDIFDQGKYKTAPKSKATLPVPATGPGSRAQGKKKLSAKDMMMKKFKI
jgi:hypothetical protein